MSKGDAKRQNNTSEDPRFAAIGQDPRFRLPKKKSLRGDIDTRFKAALHKDQRFREKAPVDKYGRRVEHDDPTQQLNRYYNLSESEAESADESASDVESKPEPDATSAAPEQDPDEQNEEDDSEQRIRRIRARMRGEDISDESSSSSDEDSSDEDEAEVLESTKDEYEQVRGTQIPEGEETRRFAVVNMDWDNVNSIDLMATFSSFISSNHRIISVKIFPSEYGKARMQEEEVNGPPTDLFDEDSTAVKKAESESDRAGAYDDDKDYSSSKLRRYQLQRLRYFYAVVECDSVAAAAAIYNKCDGAEYESTANFFDLRYIPDEMDFTQEKPRDECHKVPANYEPAHFATDALQHSNVKLTWDETPHDRQKLVQKAFGRKELEEMDLKAYLASDSESEGEDTAAKYRALLGNSETKAGEDDVDMEITFNPVLEGKDAQLNHETGDSRKDDEDLSTIEKYRQKEKERRKRRMERSKARKEADEESAESTSHKNARELELLAMDDDVLNAKPDELKDSSREKHKQPERKLTKRAAKKKAAAEAEQDFDKTDPRFQALFEDPNFAIDTTAPQYKKTKAIDEVVKERRRRQAQRDDGETTIEPRQKRPKLQIREESAKALAAKIAAKLGKKSE